MEQLLRFKKAERPDEAFWTGFDRSLQQKLFQTVVERRHSGVGNWLSAVLRARSTYAMPVVAALMVVAGIAMTRNGPVPVPAVQPAGAVDMVVSVEAPARTIVPSSSERFVVDRLNVSMAGGQFRKVMASQAMRISPASSTRYVADQLGDSSSRGGVLSASTSF